MKNIILLVKAMLKGNGLASLAGDRAKKKKKRRISGAGTMVILVFAALYMGGLAVLYVSSSFDFLKPLGLQSLVLGIAISVIAFLSFFFGLLYVMSVFYFSSDIEKLLPLPLTPGQLLVSKFIVTLIYEYLVVFALLTPAMITYGVLNKEGILFYIYMIITISLLPIIPLIMASLIIMLIMRFSPAARNKDRFTLIASVFAVFVGFGFSFGIQAILAKSASSDFSKILTDGVDKLTRISSSIFPGTYFANYALTKPEGLDSFFMMIVFLVTTAVSVIVLYVAGNLIYLKGVIGIAASASKGKILTKAEFEESTASGNAFLTYAKKDLKVLFRTPIFFVNNVLMNFLMPIILLFPLFINQSAGDFNISKIKDLVVPTLFTGNMKIAVYVLLGLFGYTVFVCGTNGISESAISREGNCAYLMKIIPMTYKDQIWAKISVGVFISSIGAILALILLVVFLMPPWWFVLLCVLVLPGAILFPNISGIIFDLYMPKIKWDNEQKAVKQNMNILYGILTATIMIGLMVALILLVPMNFVISAILIIIIPLLLSLICAIIINKIVNKTMLQLAA